jgi:AraC family transcriptional regulator
MGNNLRPRHSKSEPRRPSRTRWLSTIELTETSSGSLLPLGQLFNSVGMTAHHVRVDPKRGFDFQWKGKSHYLALHDLRHVDGETYTEALGVDRCRDLRGRLTFIPAGCRIWGWSVPRASKRQSFIALYFDPMQMETELGQKLREVPKQVQLYFTNFALRATLEKLQRALSATTASDTMYLESLCVLAVLELCILQQENLAAATRPAGRLAKALEHRIAAYVEANLGRDIGLDDLAQIASLSRFHFLRTFKQTTLETPYAYLLRRRIERGRLLLKESDMSISEISVAVGFKDATRFIRAFRRMIGVTPGAYRE